MRENKDQKNAEYGLFSRSVGAIDGTHSEMAKANKQHSVYNSEKGFFLSEPRLFKVAEIVNIGLQSIKCFKMGQKLKLKSYMRRH